MNKFQVIRDLVEKQATDQTQKQVRRLTEYGLRCYMVDYVWDPLRDQASGQVHDVLWDLFWYQAEGNNEY